MRRTAYLTPLLAWCLIAQPSRDAYRNAYRTWRQSDPTLERDAAAGAASVSERAARVAAQAANYGAQRGAFLLDLNDEEAQNMAWLERIAPPDPPLALTRGLAEFVAGQRAAVSRNIQTYASDPDRAIQQLKQALEREHATLLALAAALAERQKAANSAQDASVAMEKARLATLEQERDLLANLKEASGQISRETAAWAAYYRQIPGGAPPASTAPGPLIPPRPSVSSSRPPLSAAPPVPLARYVGAWTFPAINGLYHGPQPEAVDLVVREDNGRAGGTLIGRFKVQPGSGTDPMLQFDFSGEFKSTRNQIFKAETSDGSKGTLELIPGPAFNLLEVNFQIEAKPGKIRQANVVLVKK